MKRHALVVLALLTLGATAQANITITPTEPTPDDEVEVTVSHWTNTGGYRIDAMTCRILGNTIYLDLYWETPSLGSVVTQATVLHEQTRSLGKLAPGTYTVRVSHRNLNALGESADFTVAQEQDAEAPEPDGPSAFPSDCICQRWPQFFAGRTCPFCGRTVEEQTDGGFPSLFVHPQHLTLSW